MSKGGATDQPADANVLVNIAAPQNISQNAGNTNARTLVLRASQADECVMDLDTVVDLIASSL